MKGKWLFRIQVLLQVLEEGLLGGKALGEIRFCDPSQLSRKEFSHWLNEIRSKRTNPDLRTSEQKTILKEVRDRVALGALGAASQGFSKNIRNGPNLGREQGKGSEG